MAESNPASGHPLLEFLEPIHPFVDMAPEHRQAFVRAAQEAYYPAGTDILAPQSGLPTRLHLVRRGRVQGFAHAAEPVWELGPGEMFPLGALLERRPTKTRIRAADDCFCIEIDRAAFDALLAQSPPFADFCRRRFSPITAAAARRHRAELLDSDDGGLQRTLRECVARPPVTDAATTPTRAVLERMQAEGVGSTVLLDPDGSPVGIFTLHDLLSRIVLPQAPLDAPVQRFMTPNPRSLDAGASAFEGLHAMAAGGFTHLCVTDRGRLVGVVAERDLLRRRGLGVARLVRRIRQAPDAQALEAIASQLPEVVAGLFEQRLSIRQIFAVSTRLNDDLTARTVQLSLDPAVFAGGGWAWLSFGSEARGEQTLCTDQDNGALLPDALAARPEYAPDVGRNPLHAINEALARCGFPLCKGGVMAGNPRYARSAAGWSQRFAALVREASPDALLEMAILLDWRALAGDVATADALIAGARERARASPAFLAQFAAFSLERRPPIGLVRSFHVDLRGPHRGQMDLKKQAITPLVAAARSLALAIGSSESGTLGRLRDLRGEGVLSAGLADALVETFDFLQRIRLQACFTSVAHDDRHIRPYDLNELDQRILKEGLRLIRLLQRSVELRHGL